MKILSFQHSMIAQGRELNGIYISVFISVSLIFLTSNSYGQEQKDLPSPSALKKLSMEELMSIEVTSVSKRPEKLTEVASAIQVITQEDIKRSGATNIPEALRLAPNLQTAEHLWESDVEALMRVTM